MTKIAPIALLAATTFLTACGGSGGGSGSGTGPVTIQEINSVGEDFVDIQNGFEADSVTFQSQDILIAQGSANYEGYMIAGNEGADDIFVGRTDIDVTFTDGGNLSGTVTDFVTFIDTTDEVTVNEDEEIIFEALPTNTPLTEIDGSLTLTGGALGTEDNIGVIDITVTGSITVPASVSFTDAQETYTIDGEMIGAVTSEDQFYAEGRFDAVDGETSFEGFAAILAD